MLMVNKNDFQVKFRCTFATSSDINNSQQFLFHTMTTFQFSSSSYTKQNAVESFKQWINENCPAFLEHFYLDETQKSVYAVSRNNGRTADYKTTKAIQWQSGKSYPLDQTMVNQLLKLVTDDIVTSAAKKSKADVTERYRQMCDGLSTPGLSVRYGTEMSGIIVIVIESDTMKLTINPYRRNRLGEPIVRPYKGSVEHKTIFQLMEFANRCKTESDAILAHLPKVLAAIPETFWKA